ncbi:Concanavalin A-like lectin/glucanases superfamily [Penicillium vulpinum]|uniref:endo-1,3(4)-beta-glucanase n=1 Tax=Penicillium vulpinum TaxID=29845 RepID=A0A1V6RMF1_9EURO|nr:Concanavalin A-like lectin/glucanases superfamily [Penicillium vulpinum]KAJ5960818.1 Concanavalin A-like lectin/glucanases superfamily [Penicillium vulpinum]OQE02728.1 hypothetical protein PENVUL_c039G03595 [Penicillium vulpinum]
MVSSKRSLSAGSLMLALLCSPVAATTYSLVETWQGKNFLDYFNFHVGSDPTNGFVNYIDKESAESSGLVKITDSGSVYLGVDHATKLDPYGKKGRDSVRIGTKKYYDQSLVIADIAHMPGSVCGTWPAFWSVGKNWPGDGEIDIIEGVNMHKHNEIVMHTSGTCSMTDTDMTGSVNATGCGEELGPVGCVIEGHEGSYGTPFNEQKGGVYSLQWTDDFLKIWYFPRQSIPASITSGKPDVTEFGTPMAVVAESCDVGTAFKAQSFVFDVTFCGDWAGGVYGGSGCPMTHENSFQSCHNYVANNPSQFAETYWEINSVKIYQTGAKAKAIASAASSEPEPATTTAAPVVSHTTTQTHTTHTVTAETHTTQTAPVHTTTSKEETVGVIQELTLTSTPTVAATTENPTTEEVKQSSTGKKTRTITSFVTATETICPDAEKSSAISADSSATAPVSAVESVQTPTTVKDTKPTTAGAGVDALSSHASVPTSHGHASYSSAPGATSGAPWSQPPLPSAVVSSVPYEASKAPNPAPTDAPTEDATSATSGSYVPSGSQSGFGPVFTGAADRLSMSISALFFGFIVAFLA